MRHGDICFIYASELSSMVCHSRWGRGTPRGFITQWTFDWLRRPATSAGDQVRPHLFVGGLAHVQQLAPEREHAVAVPTDHAQARHGQRFGRVSLRQDQCAVQGVPSAGVVGILQLGDACAKQR